MVLVPNPARNAATILDGTACVSQRVVVCGNDPALPCRHVFAGLKGERGEIADAARRTVAVTRAMRVRGVFDDTQFVFPCDGRDRIHFSNLTGEVNGNDASRAWRDRSLDCRWSDVERVEIDVCEDRNGIRFNDRRGSRHKRVGRNDDLVFRANANGEQGDAEGHSPVHDGDAMLTTVHLRKTLLELGHLIAAQASPLTAAQCPKQSLLLGLAKDWPRGERLRANRRSTKQRKSLHNAKVSSP